MISLLVQMFIKNKDDISNPSVKKAYGGRQVLPVKCIVIPPSIYK